MKKNFNLWMIAFFALLALMIGVGGTLAYVKYSAPKQPKTDDKTVEVAKKYTFDLQKYAVLGNEAAPVTIVEFSDFQCPACSYFYSKVYPDFKKQLLDSGKAKLYLIDFPLLDIHPQAEKAAEASHCAQEQGKYWEMHDALYASQKDWSGKTTAEKTFNKLAKNLNLDTTKFADCLKTEKYKPLVLEGLKAGMEAEVEGTPTFYLNGEKKFFGVYPVSNFLTELAKLQ